tara:strand:- start:73 stop:471 length:399 start_codon:yes stop_codon:yes gene_type:complete
MKKSELKSFIKENIIDILSEVSDEELENLEDYSNELDAVIDKQKELGKLQKEEDDDDKDAVKGAMKARGKFKKLDLAVKALKDIETEMKSLARKYSKADESEKEKIKDILRAKTPKKKELEQLVAKLEKDVV